MDTFPAPYGLPGSSGFKKVFDPLFEPWTVMTSKVLAHGATRTVKLIHPIFEFCNSDSEGRQLITHF